MKTRTRAASPAIRILRASDDTAVSALVDRRPARAGDVDRAVAAIIGRVRKQGDRGLLAFARKFDRLEGSMEVTAAEMRASARTVPAPVKRAIGTAAANIRAVAARQVPRSWTVSPTPGLRITQRVTPLDRVGWDDEIA